MWNAMNFLASAEPNSFRRESTWMSRWKAWSSCWVANKLKTSRNITWQASNKAASSAALGPCEENGRKHEKPIDTYDDMGSHTCTEQAKASHAGDSEHVHLQVFPQQVDINSLLCRVQLCHLFQSFQAGSWTRPRRTEYTSSIKAKQMERWVKSSWSEQYCSCYDVIDVHLTFEWSKW